jgi:hypothetical protein
VNKAGLSPPGAGKNETPIASCFGSAGFLVYGDACLRLMKNHYGSQTPTDFLANLESLLWLYRYSIWLCVTKR